MDLGASWAGLKRSKRGAGPGTALRRLLLVGLVAGLLASPPPAPGSSDVARPPGAIDGRGWELVSQPDKNSYQLSQLLPISNDGTRALYALYAGGAADSSAGQGIFAAYRTAAGWRSQNALPPRAAMPASTYVLGASTPDLSSWIGSAVEGFGSSDQTPDVSVARLDDAGAQQLLRTFPIFFGLNGVPVITSDDLRHVLVAVPQGADPELPGYVAGALSESTTNVFDLGYDPPRLVDAMPLTGAPPTCGVNGNGGTMGFPGSGLNSTSEHWIASDGRRAFFATRGDACSDPRQLYVRDLAAQTTTLVSGPPVAGDPDNGVDRFLQATPDGSLVFFRATTSYDPADDADGDASDRDIYRWSAATGALTCITCAVPEANVPTTTGGGTFSNAVIAEDGSHVYFPSAVQAADAPAAGTAATPNLYVWRASDDSIHYVARIVASGPDGGLANVPYFGGQATPDGEVLIFRANQPELDALSDSVNGGTYQYYRYDDRDRGLMCVSCPAAGAATTSIPLELASANAIVAVAPRIHAVTDDGSTVFFSTQATLAVDDVNRNWDIYEWHDGVVRLITSGVTSYPGDNRPFPVGASADGRDFLFEDLASLTWEARDASYKAYDARVGGGFPQPPSLPACEGDRCQGLPPSPAALTDPGSATLHGARNVRPGPRFAVRRPTAAQRARLARSGRLRLAVRVDRAGRLSARAQARIGGRIDTVALAVTRVRTSGTATLTLRLTPAARRQLAAHGRLRLVVAVGFSKVAVVQRMSLLLRSAHRGG